MIDFTHSTKASRMASIVILIGIIPALSFYLGLEYMLTQHMVQAAEENIIPVTYDDGKCEE